MDLFTFVCKKLFLPIVTKSLNVTTPTITDITPIENQELEQFNLTPTWIFNNEKNNYLKFINILIKILPISSCNNFVSAKEMNNSIKSAYGDLLQYANKWTYPGDSDEVLKLIIKQGVGSILIETTTNPLIFKIDLQSMEKFETRDGLLVMVPLFCLIKNLMLFPLNIRINVIHQVMSTGQWLR